MPQITDAKDQAVNGQSTVRRRRKPGRSTAQRLSPSIRVGSYGALLLWALFVIIFGILSPNAFLTTSTFQITFSGGVVTTMLGLAFLVPLAAGAFDLSIGAMMGLSLVIMAWSQSHHPHFPILLVGVIALLICCAVGLISGWLIVRWRVNSLIATLGVSQCLSAAALLISNNRQIVGAFSERWSSWGNRDIAGVPIVLVYLAVLGVVLWVLLEHTPIGRHLFAVGGNPEAARLAGLPVNAITYGSLAASAGIAGLAGIVYSMQVGIYSATAGPGLLFPALAAVFFGASQFSRRPNVWGTIVAYFALAFGVTGLQIAFGPGTFWIEPLFQGLALLIAVALASRVVGETRRKRRAQAVAAMADETAGT